MADGLYHTTDGHRFFQNGKEVTGVNDLAQKTKSKRKSTSHHKKRKSSSHKHKAKKHSKKHHQAVQSLT